MGVVNGRGNGVTGLRGQGVDAGTALLLVRVLVKGVRCETGISPHDAVSGRFATIPWHQEGCNRFHFQSKNSPRASPASASGTAAARSGQREISGDGQKKCEGWELGKFGITGGTNVPANKQSLGRAEWNGMEWNGLGRLTSRTRRRGSGASIHLVGSGSWFACVMTHEIRISYSTRTGLSMIDRVLFPIQR